MNELPQTGSPIHLIAVCGVGMASLAGLLQSRGYRVTGSDQNIYPPMSLYLADLGINVLPGFREEHLNPEPTLVVVGNSVSRSNPEVQELLRLGIPYVSFPEALKKFLIGSKLSIVVAGTHGKTTTTALMAWVLTKAGWNPSFFVGGVPVNFGTGFRDGKGNCAVLEGDEYDSAFFDKGPKFLHYKPDKVILTSVEFDHADIYRDLDHLKQAFQHLVEMIPATGTLLVCNEYSAAIEVSAYASCPTISYGDGGPTGWEARNIRIVNGKISFEPHFKGTSEGPVEIGLLGKHNVKNALAVYAMARGLGIAREILQEALATFLGVKRRQEIKGEVGGILVVDDFAHHPTAVTATLEAIKMTFPGRRLWAIFEPRSNTSRRRIFEREFAQGLAAADRVVISGLYQPEKIPEAERLSPERVTREINRLSGDGRALPLQPVDKIPHYVAHEAARGDVIVVMSNGGFNGVQEQILQLLKQKER